MSTTPFTVIPSSQPSCGDISASQPIPHCPNVTTTTNPANPNASDIVGEPMGCFIQANGLFCASIATTRGFLYSLDSAQQQQQQQQRGVLPFLVPRLSTATNNNNNNTNNNETLAIGVDGRPVNYQGPVRLGETCYPIPLPPITDPLFQTLVAVANQRLNETLGSTGATPTPGGGGGWKDGYRLPGVGAGVQVFNFRGDCEQGSYCDFVPAGAEAGGAVVTGTCKEMLPNFHNCTSYAQCSSLRCDQLRFEGGRNSTAGNTSDGGVTVCLPSKLDRGNTNHGGGGPGGGDGDKPSKFPAWIGGIIAIVVVFGAAIAFGLVRRRKKMAADKEMKSLKKRRRSARSQTAAVVAAATPTASSEQDRRRSMSLPLHSQQDHEHQHHLGDGDDDDYDKESDYVYQLHSGEPSLIVNEKQDLSAAERGNGGFGRWFRRSRTEDQIYIKDLGDEKGSMTTGSSRSSVRSSFSLGRDGKKPESPISTGGHGVSLNSHGAAAGEAFEGSIHSDSTTAVVLESANPRSRLSVDIPRIVTTPSNSAAATATVPRAYAEGEERDVVTTGLLYYTNENNYNLNNRPSLSSATTSFLNESGTSSSSPPSSDLSRRSSNHAYLAAAGSSTTPPPGSPVSPISPISPRPPLSSVPSSRSSQRLSLQQQQQQQQQLASSSPGGRNI